MTPSGNLRVDSLMYVTTVNSLEEKVQEFEDIPIVTNGSATVAIHDIATVADAMDVTVDYALINGKRSVYLPVVKTADASTWGVVQDLKSKLPEMQNLLPDDVRGELRVRSVGLCDQRGKKPHDGRCAGCYSHRVNGTVVPAGLAQQYRGDHYHSGIGIE